MVFTAILRNMYRNKRFKSRLGCNSREVEDKTRFCANGESECSCRGVSGFLCFAVSDFIL